MKYPRARALLAAGVLVVLVPLGVATPVAAMPDHHGVVPPRTGQPAATSEGTKLIATSGTVSLTKLGALKDVKATLRSLSGAPVPGKTIFFYGKGGRPFGTVVTDEAGKAELTTVSSDLGVSTAQELLGGYTAKFFGDDDWAASQASGIITLGV